ncbi:MAG: SRPBCC family protein [Paracoccaceae bacterium]
MKFSLKEDVALPAESVFAAVSDFAQYERLARQRGAEMTRRDPGREPVPGSAWDLRFPWRGRERRMSLLLTALTPPRRLELTGRSANLDTAFAVEVLPLARDRARIVFDIDIRPRTITARLVVQSARLARGRITVRLAARLRAFARDTEARAGRG